VPCLVRVTLGHAGAADGGLLERYLQAWYPILMQAPQYRVLTYAEGFAGSGIYAGGEPGSPVIAAGVFLSRKQFLQAGKRLNMVLIEADKRRLDRLRQEMDAAIARLGPKPDALQVFYQPGECATELLPTLSRAGARDGPIFAVLDSFGGPDVPLTLARAIAEAPSSEVLVTFGTNFLTRFGGRQAHQESGDQAFGGMHWRQVRQLPAGDKKAFLVGAYRRSLQRAGFRYVVSFEMTDDTGADLHLVFGTGSRKGLEKMKDAMWGVDPVRGLRYRDPRDPAQLALGLDLHPDLRPLEHALLAELDRGQRTVAQLQDHALLETVYRGPHATRAVQAMLRRGLVECDAAEGQLRKTTRIRLTAAGHQQLHAPPGTLF
jgi:three-Cys-motif partner protein